jgi:hypothetical protein
MKLNGWQETDVLITNRELMMRDFDRDARPIGFTAFNRFHHGGKVLDQDVQILENCIAVGERDGREMNAIRSLLDKWRDYHH